MLAVGREQSWLCQRFLPSRLLLARNSLRLASQLPRRERRLVRTVAGNQSSTNSFRRQLLLGTACGCGLCVYAARSSSAYQRFFAYAMATSMREYEEQIAPIKHELFDKAFQQGPVRDVVEVGMGTGPNLKYLAADTQQGLRSVIGVDPNPAMDRYAQRAAKHAGLSSDQLQLRQGVAEGLPLPDACADLVVCTLVLCSVKSPGKALQEMRRILKEKGQLLFVEHVLAPPEQPGLRLAQRLLDPLQQFASDGCHLTRDTLPLVRASGFTKVEASSFMLEQGSLIGPHVSGLAIK
ncbi:hypothetical protein WJX74_009653 [Apatococcus lobatus]|uniref:Methyltransferase type 11 domain-containing protein n=1 Tax=Apatococcus lobatus TaxID=904363 RepID=A0AAW1RMI0_9CHLO